MSEIDVPPSKTTRAASIAEFRRWLILVFVLAILGGCLDLLLPQVGGKEVWDFAILGFWVAFTAAEGWIQLDNAVRRIAWPFAGCVTGLVFMLTRPSMGFAVFLVPGAIEYLTARNVRRRAWVWLLFTPLLYGTIDSWADEVGTLTKQIVGLVSNAAGVTFMSNRNVAELAAVFSVVLLSRAIVGSFIASRKIEGPRETMQPG